ncbi:Uncharacterised protein [Mycobacterium tuberculosis]|uniref:Uncharacterized protein n=1 Tax=Mycobacterium tuberculosis TaxID=1773 RepID=A0A654U8U0_MYCTX|nr:Uncharacterised protein [Mycobacterium tuberculosis]
MTNPPISLIARELVIWWVRVSMTSTTAPKSEPQLAT